MQSSYSTKSIRTNQKVQTDPNRKQAEKQRTLQRQKQREQKRAN